MAEASQSREVIRNAFPLGWVVQRGTATRQGGLLVLDNAYVDHDGSIFGRQGTIPVNSQPLDDGTGSAQARIVHSHKLQSALRYFGVGSVVKRGFDPGATIISGLSGRRLTFASMSPSFATPELWTYFANGDKTQHGAASGDCRKKDNGTITRNWGIDGPNATVTVELADDLPESELIDDFGAAYTSQGDNGGTEAAAADAYDTDARKFTVTEDTAERFRRTEALDLSGFTEEDFIRVMLRVDKVSHLDHIELAFNLSATTEFTDDYYWIRIEGNQFLKDNTWQEFRLRKKSFTRVSPTDGSTLSWADVQHIQFTVSANTNGDVVVSADEMLLQRDTHADGVFDYKLTWWNDDLKIRSNARSLQDIYSVTERISAQIHANRQRIVIDRTTVTTTDPQVTHWELWRRDINLTGIFQFVARIPISETEYNDDKNNLQLGEALVEDNHIPPAGRFIFSFDDRMWICGMGGSTFIGDAVFVGAGIDDMSTGGVFTGSAAARYIVEITGTGTPDTFKWSDDGGDTYTTGVLITGSLQTLSNGAAVQFGTTDGHTVGDRWEFSGATTGHEESPFALRFSERLRPESFPLTNYVLAGDPEDPIRGFAVREGRAYIWTKRHIYQVLAVGDRYVVQKTEAPVGTESPYAIASSPYGIIYYAPEDGPYLFNGSTAVSMSSEQLDPVFAREIVTQDGITIPAADANTPPQFENVVGAYYNRYYFLVYKDTDGFCPTAVYNFDSRRWYKCHGTNYDLLQRLMWEKGGDDFGSADNLEGGTSDGYLVKLEPNPRLAYDTGDTPDAIHVAVQYTFDAELKNTDAPADFKDVVVDADSAGQAVTVAVSFDDRALVTLGSQFPRRRQKLFFPIAQEKGTIAYKMSVRVTIRQRNERVKIFGIGTRYWLQPRAQRSLSGQYFFVRCAGWVRKAHLIIRSTATVTMVVSGDGQEKVRVNLEPSENLRAGRKVPLPAGVSGKVLEYTLLSSEDFSVYPGSYFEIKEYDTDRDFQPWSLI